MPGRFRACRPAASTSAGPPSSPPRRWSRRCGCTSTSSMPRSPSPAPTSSNRVIIDGPKRRFGIVTTGKSYLDVRQALDDLGIDDDYAARHRPLALQGRHDLAAGARGRAALRRGPRGDPGRRGKARADREPAQGAALQLAGERAAARSSASSTRSGDWILPSADELTPARIARVIAKRIARFHTSPAIEERLDVPGGQGEGADRLQAADPAASPISAPAARTTPRPACPRAAARWPASAATTWRSWMDRNTDDLHPDGRRRRHLDRPGAVHQDAARLPEPGRRHLLPFRPAGDPRRGRRRASTSPTRSCSTTRSP